MASQFALTLRNNAGYILQITVKSGGQLVDTSNWHAKFAVRDNTTNKQLFQIGDDTDFTGGGGPKNITFGGADGTINIILTPDLYSKIVTAVGQVTTIFDLLYTTPSQPAPPLTLLTGPVTFQQGAVQWT